MKIICHNQYENKKITQKRSKRALVSQINYAKRFFFCCSAFLCNFVVIEIGALFLKARFIFVIFLLLSQFIYNQHHHHHKKKKK